MAQKPEKLKLGLVSPYPWTSHWGVNRHIASLAVSLGGLGHDVSIIAPSEERDEARAARRRVRAARRARDSDAQAVAPPPQGRDEWIAAAGVKINRVRGTFRFPYSEHLANLALPLEVTEELDLLLSRENFDLLHVHEPYPPSLSFTALRLAQSPVVASFHTAGERFLSFQLLRPVVERFFERLDGRICTSQNTRRIVSSYFPSHYSVIGCGVDTARFYPPADEAKSGERPRVTFAAWSNARKGLALLSRVVRLLPSDVPPFELAIVGGEELRWRSGLIIPRRLRHRVRFAGNVSGVLEEAYRRTDVLLAPYATASQACALMEAMACGTAMIVPGEGGLKELVKEGVEGLLLDHPYSYNLAAGMVDLLCNDALLRSLGKAAGRRVARTPWEKVAATVARDYARAHRRRRRAPAAHGAIGLQPAETILADLHMHTSFSSDCLTTPKQLLAACRESGLDAIAITDHNTLAGALEVARLAPPDLHVIVGEEVKTTEGEIIGLYLREEVPAGVSPEEAIARIKGQGGLVYLPHPFDPLHKTPPYETLARNAADIDIVEVYNPRITFVSFNDRARRLARKYDIPGAAGSDCHVVEGVGTAMISLRRFDDAAGLLLSLREADIIRSSVSPIYLHSLKLLKNGMSAMGARE